MLDRVTLNQCVERLAREPSLVAAWLFGSAVTGRLREDSDVDLALYYESGKESGWSALGDLAFDLEAILKRKVDLGRINSRNLVYAVEVFKTGQLIYAFDEPSAMAVASRLQSLYLDLKQDRKVVEEAYCA